MGTSKILIDGVGIDLTQDTVAANKMLSGVKAHDSNGDSVTGSIPSKAAQTYTPGTTDQSIAAGQYLTGAQTIKGDANLVANNIKQGVSIFGVNGDLTPGITPSISISGAMPFATVTATSGAHSYSATADGNGNAVISGIEQSGIYIVSDTWSHVEITIVGTYHAPLRSVPMEYQRVEWIEAANSNGAYIDLGIVFDTKAKTEITFYTTSATGHLFGATENGGSLRYCASFPYGGGWCLYGSSGSGFIDVARPVSTLPAGRIYTFMMLAQPGLLSLNDADTELIARNNAQGSYTMTRNLYLLGQNYNTGYRGQGQKRVYSFKHWDKNDVLVRDMVPCYRREDNVIGMYDLVSRTFFTNAGTGVFTCGGDVN